MAIGIDITGTVARQSIYKQTDLPSKEESAAPAVQEKKEESHQESLDSAMGILGLVSFGTPLASKILNVSDLKDSEDPQTLIKLANQIIQLRKNNGPVSFENGRIFMARETYQDLLNSVKDPSLYPEQKVVVIKNPVSAAIMHESLEIKKGFELLSSITDPKGIKYVTNPEQFEDNKKNRKILEDSLKKFWGDYGSGAPLAVKSQKYSYSIDPKMIIGNAVNAEVSEKLKDIHKKQHT